MMVMKYEIGIYMGCKHQTWRFFDITGITKNYDVSCLDGPWSYLVNGSKWTIIGIYIFVATNDNPGHPNGWLVMK